MPYVPPAEPVDPPADLDPPPTLPSEDALAVLRRAAAAAGVDPDALTTDETVIPPDDLEAERQAEIESRRRATGSKCVECDEEISVRDTNLLTEVRGWSRRRADGGQNHVISRVETGRYMCGACATRLRAGLIDGQEPLL